jgi:DNA polymerase elongation subunit (family B)
MSWANTAGILRPRRLLKILDFDIETRLVGFYEAGRFKPKGSEPTAIAASWVGSDEVSIWLQPEYAVEEMLLYFAELYEQADIVTGHYIRKFDLPILQGSMFEHGIPLLDPLKLVQDTQVDLKPFDGLSKSQENLAEMLEIEESKFKMNDVKWRRSTRLQPEGIALARKRATQDVIQHKQLRKALLEAGVLNPPTLWNP